MEKKSDQVYNFVAILCRLAEGDTHLSSVNAFEQFQWMDSGTHTGTPIEPLALDEAFARAMSEPGAKPLIHLWIYDSALFLGRRDAKLPHLEAALRQMGAEGYGAVLRSSGGACVPLDAGVVNMAFLLPDTSISIDSFFQLVASMLEVGLHSYGKVTFGEVTGSYCVGDYDFACDGKKIGGMAQRRTRHGSILQLCINVDDLPRGELMERFYRIAGLADMNSGKPIPHINGATIGSLAAATGLSLQAAEVKEALFTSISSQWNVVYTPFVTPTTHVEDARQHLTEKLGLFSFQAKELQHADWTLPR